jgi:3-methyladenine DNA glycosylase AlkD
MNPVIEQVRAELLANIDQQTKASANRFFKETITVYGVKTATVGKIAKNHWHQIKGRGKQEIFGLCEELLASGVMEEAFVVSDWLPRLIDQLEPADLETFGAWIDRYIDNWAKCDSLCNHTVGGLIEKYPETVQELKQWSKSPNRWLKRASAVSLIVPAKRGLFLQDAIEISTTLLADPDDMVQKGYGWLLKEESRKHQHEILQFVVANRKTMPRTALRYAIELMPKEVRQEAMKKE